MTAPRRKKTQLRVGAQSLENKPRFANAGLANQPDVDGALTVIPQGRPQVLYDLLLVRRGNEIPPHLGVRRPLLVIKELKAGQVFDLQAYSWEPTEQSTDFGLAPDFDPRVFIFRIGYSAQIGRRL